ncbi:MAG: GWxTD domain-containing protein [Gemmatimonadetes bacterium]|nr:GWxTD domain-containing protein [Gemmatimonadota bacterium]
MGVKAAAFAAALSLLSAQAEPARDTPSLALYRFSRPERGVLVSGVLSIPFALLRDVAAPGAGEAGGPGVYECQVVVSGAEGELFKDSWSQEIADSLLASGGSTVDLFSFAVDPGTYRLAVRVRSAGGAFDIEREIEAFADPRASDLVLSQEIRRTEREASAGEIRKGPYVIVASALPAVTSLSPRLFYYVEIYGEGGAGGSDSLAAQTRLTAWDSAGRQVFQTSWKTLLLPASGGIDVGGVNLRGLPSGSYTVEAAVQAGGETVTRAGRFRLIGVREPMLAAAPVEDEVSRGLAELNDAELDSIYKPLAYFLAAEQKAVFEALAPEARRRFLREYFARRDPNGPQPGNAFHDEYLERVEYANQYFYERGGSIRPGWLTDRGRIYLRYGAPDDVFRGNLPEAQRRDFVVWKYSRDRDLKFVFLDETGFGHFNLIYTNDRTEASRPNWQGLLGSPEAVEMVNRF